MPKKMPQMILLLVTLVLTLLLTGLLFAYQSSPPELPQGVSASDWVPLAPNLGVQLIRDSKFIGPPGDLYGTLYVKEKNAWHKIYLTPASGFRLIK